MARAYHLAIFDSTTRETATIVCASIFDRVKVSVDVKHRNDNAIDFSLSVITGD
jgi:hypothetical protein